MEPGRLRPGLGQTGRGRAGSRLKRTDQMPRGLPGILTCAGPRFASTD